MNFKDITDWVNWITQSGLLVWLFLGLGLFWPKVKSWLQMKEKTAKTVQQREVFQLAEKLAEMAVNSLVSNNAITGNDKFKIAANFVKSELEAQGHEVSDDMVNHTVQAAYEKSDLTPSVDPNAKPQTGVVVHVDNN